MKERFAELADEVEAALVINDDLAERTISALGEYSEGLQTDKADLDSTDKVLALIHAVRPGWDVTIKGNVRMPNGHWRCTLRKSAGRDNDEYLGVARGPTLPHSLLASLLKVLSFESR